MFIANLTITDDSIFTKAALEIAAKNVQLPAGEISAKTKQAIRSIILSALINSPTVQDLLSGKLKDDLGLFGNVVNSTMENVATYIIENIELTQTKKGKGKNALPQVNLKLLQKDINKIIKVPGASFKSRGGSVDWLEWLLTRGTEVIISDYWIFPHAKGTTRSGGTKVMQKISKKSRDPFRIDPAHAGTVDDNFITRALDSASDEITNLVMSSMMGGG